MQKDKCAPVVCAEDEIDLRELFLTLKKHKKFIIIFTLLVTTIAAIYAFSKTPIYVASAIVEIGNYKLDNNNKVLLDNVSQLTKELNDVFVDMHKNDKDVSAKIVSITIPKKQETFIDIKAEGKSNKLASQKISEVVAYIKAKHQKILDDVSERRKFEINNIERKIQNIKNKEIALLDNKISLQEKSLHDYARQIELIEKNFKLIENKNPTLAALELMQKRDLSDFILKLNLQLIDLKDKKDNLDTDVVWDLQEKKNLLASMLLPHNYKNSHIVGAILTNDYPAKPKKKLIIIVAFITGLILSIFLVFFIEFIKGFKEE
jgi:capsular polysaccharide biosynthesis protein